MTFYSDFFNQKRPKERVSWVVFLCKTSKRVFLKSLLPSFLYTDFTETTERSLFITVFSAKLSETPAPLALAARACVHRSAVQVSVASVSQRAFKKQSLRMNRPRVPTVEPMREQKTTNEEKPANDSCLPQLGEAKTPRRMDAAADESIYYGIIDICK
jgi:hypothetical protein